MVFLVKFDGVLYFQGFEGIFGGIVVIFDDVKSGEMLDFSGFYRSGYRSGFWVGLRCNVSETLILEGVCGWNRYGLLRK